MLQLFGVILHTSSHSINNGYVQFRCIQQELNPRVRQLWVGRFNHSAMDASLGSLYIASDPNSIHLDSFGFFRRNQWNERTSIQILDLRIERNQEFSRFLGFMDPTRFGEIFHFLFFPPRALYETFWFPNLECPNFTWFTGFNSSTLHDQRCSTACTCSSGPYIQSK